MAHSRGQPTPPSARPSLPALRRQSSSSSRMGSPSSATPPSNRIFYDFGSRANLADGHFTRTVANDNFAVELKGDVLIMDNFDAAGNDVDQQWMVDCRTCADISQKTGIVATECIITSNTNGFCVTANPGAQLTLSTCVSGQANQLFNFSV
ncbi:uncharacterized protein BT62DRAFT_470169 [Guyanagaster necrorhizus]|uniref:Uncharacterized protein n=1 Tax=Guyanagaster necrorhizus TaxID=856835 RepID=A0A9P7VJH1_9AGAR|nr:uncharacterized protein BT62DRAFT_470169 [Guyanagaster necrorhizus MCA 3950]KAG7441683.1 hypothetical protein BT62DRAFT_470169 [Guyanagaster necrorhizus MCA 3950]